MFEFDFEFDSVLFSCRCLLLERCCFLVMIHFPNNARAFFGWFFFFFFFFKGLFTKTMPNLQR